MTIMFKLHTIVSKNAMQFKIEESASADTQTDPVAPGSELDEVNILDNTCCCVSPE